MTTEFPATILLLAWMLDITFSVCYVCGFRELMWNDIGIPLLENQTILAPKAPVESTRPDILSIYIAQSIWFILPFQTQELFGLPALFLPSDSNHMDHQSFCRGQQGVHSMMMMDTMLHEYSWVMLFHLELSDIQLQQWLTKLSMSVESHWWLINLSSCVKSANSNHKVSLRTSKCLY